MRVDSPIRILTQRQAAVLLLPALVGALPTAAALAAGARTPPAATATPSAAEIEFFENRIRPVLAEKCWTCHGEKIQQAGLRLDRRDGLMKTAASGQAAVIPGRPEAGTLLAALRHTGKVKMPPGGRLPDAQIADFEAWVRAGAPWPDRVATRAPSAGGHWAFRPVADPPLPRVKNRAWTRADLDYFVLAALEQKGLTPSAPADRRTLIRRATFDLWGLPPDPADVERFVADRSPDAWPQLIDRLLASPRYGERWGRYWLDIARYADTKGYVFTEERRYPFAYTYRDWVIEALNRDMPYDRFIQAQIAADLLPETRRERKDLAALGFLTLGRRFLNNQPDIIDDRMDVVMRGTQALTVGCARCHDHKYDPIPMDDYYSLYGVFASTREPEELPLIGEADDTPEYRQYEAQVKKLQQAVDAFLDEQHRRVLDSARSTVADCLMIVRAGGDIRRMRGQAGAGEPPPALLRRWGTFLAAARQSHHPIFAAWFAFVEIPEAEFAARAPETAARIARNNDRAHLYHPEVAALFRGAPPATLREVADRLQKLLTSPTGDQGILHALDSIGGPLNIERGDTAQFLERDARNRLQQLRMDLDRFRATSPAAPPRAMVLVDLPNPVQPRVFLRGNANNPGKEVPRRYLAVLSPGGERSPFLRGSGRLELAEAITSESNPLTARVMVNRVWAGHFGAPLVRTPSDFGLRSDPPANPGLLDHLASRFMAGGWSLKNLHRTIMLSATYQQSSAERPRELAQDPENTLVWRMNRRRLDFEALRDSILFAGGKLDLAMGGKSVDILSRPFSTRRTVYGFIDRQNLPGVFRAFDFASPDTHSPQRFQTTVPQQALFLMNGPFVVEQARNLAARPEVAAATRPEERLRALYRILYARRPEPQEQELALRFIQDSPDGPSGADRLTAWERLAQALLLTNEFVFVD